MWDFFSNFLSILWFTLWIVIWVSFIILVFRDKSIGGFAKFLWIAAIVLLPVLGALVYVITRGRSMAQRDLEAAEGMRAAQVEYTKGLMNEAGGPASEIKAAKDLLDAGTITAEEYEAIKAKALA